MYTGKLRAYIRARNEYHKRVRVAVNWLTIMIWTMLVMTLSLLFTIGYVIASNNIPLVLVKYGG